MQLPEDAADHRFRGDAVLVNDRLAWCSAAGRQGRNSTAWAPPDRSSARCSRPRASEPAAKLQAVAVVASDPSQAAVDATFQSPGGRTSSPIRYELAMGQTFVKTEPREGARG